MITTTTRQRVIDAVTLRIREGDEALLAYGNYRLTIFDLQARNPSHAFRTPAGRSRSPAPRAGRCAWQARS